MPLSHLDADEDSAEWGCRVPVALAGGRPVYTPLLTAEPSDQSATPAAPLPSRYAVAAVNVTREPGGMTR
jgi:hypothetical protein